MPSKLAFGATFFGLADKSGDQKNEAEPVFSVGSEAGPIHRAAQMQLLAENACLLLNFPHHAGMHILVRPHLAAQAVVFAEMLIILPGIAAQEQNLAAVRGKDITKGADDGFVHDLFWQRRAFYLFFVKSMLQLTTTALDSDARGSSFSPHHNAMQSAVKHILFALFFVVLAVWPVSAQFTSAGWVTVPADTGFPMYPIIMPNIRFWEKIYGTYTENQGVLHDRDNLDVIYGTVNFVSKHTPGAAKINEKLIDFSRQNYKNMLIKFATGGKAENKEEQRIYLLFARRTPEVFREASENIRLQTGLKRHFRDGVIRSGAYMPMIKRVLRQQGLPEELAYLPHVESSFNPKAHSKAGAAGLWQFTRSTGRDFMTINELVDERYDPHIATEAAARFLKGNHRSLGSWPLALTAYNHGRAGMLRAKEQWGSYPAVFARHSSATFGFASKNFYSEFVAAYRAAKRLQADHSVIRDRPWASATLHLKGYAAVKDLLRYFGVSADEFRRLNPALRQPVLDGEKYIPKGVKLHLPATHFIRERIRTLPDRLLHSSQLADSRPETGSRRTYTVKRGDTALGIARRFGITLDTLRRLNRLNKKADVQIGQRLTVPGSSGSSSRRMIKSKAKRRP